MVIDEGMFVISQSYLIFQKPDVNQKLFAFFDDKLTIIINNKNNAEKWKVYQDVLGCCGYKENVKTGSVCADHPERDCRSIIFGVLSDSILATTIMLTIITVYVGLLACTSKCMLDDNRGC